jgi:hypothetical protein
LPGVYFVLAMEGFSNASKRKSPPAGLSKEEEARDAICGEMWREMGEWD